LPRYADETLPEVIALAHQGLRKRLEQADAVERAQLREMQLHQRLDFILVWLREYSKHFSMAQVAERIGVSRQAISKIRKGEAVPQRLLIPLATDLGVDHRFLTEGVIDYPQSYRFDVLLDELGPDLTAWVLADEPGRHQYVRAALELGRAAESSNVDLRFFERILELYHGTETAD
jgi:transcriptional regulator with XRE-family HTH domain